MMNMKLKRIICTLLVISCLTTACLASSGGNPADEPLFLDSRTVLVGDSLTCLLIAQWLRPGNLLGGASYMAAPNSAVNYFFEDWWPLEPLEQNTYYCEVSPGLEGMTFAEAVEATAGKFTRVLFLMGSNSSQYSVVSDYTSVIDCMLENWPEATIYMQTVPDSPTGAVETDRINGVIADAVAEYEAAGETRVKLLDTNSCWGEGCFLSDGIHLTVLGLQKWYEYLAKTLGPNPAPDPALSADSPEELRRAKDERLAKYLAKSWFIVSPLER